MKIFAFVLVMVLTPVRAFAETFSVAGIVEAAASVEMKTKASGTIGRIAVAEGDRVKEGMMLLELENKRERALIELARAKVQSAQASIEERKIALQSGQKELQRKEIMKDVIPRKELENALDNVLQHEAAVAVRESEFQVAVAELNLREAELENTFIRAPFNGVVTEIYVEEGETVRALEDRICSVYSLDEMLVRVAIPVGFIRFVNGKTEVGLEIEKESGILDQSLKGRVRYVNPTVEPTSRTFCVRIEIVDPDRLVRPGMRANAIFRLPEGILPALSGADR